MLEHQTQISFHFLPLNLSSQPKKSHSLPEPRWTRPQSESFRIQDEDPRYRQESKYRFAALIAQTTFEISLWGKATF